MTMAEKMRDGIQMVALLIVLLSIGQAAGQPASGAPALRVILVGDSTMAPRTGYGDALCGMLQPAATCVNLARGGRSSASFRAEGLWDRTMELLAPGGRTMSTWVLIQFGHNDMPGKGPKRETDPETTYRQNLIRYIEEARAIGAKPILVTSLARRTFDNGKIRGELKPWADAARKVAAEQQVPLVDLFVRSVDLHNQLGVTASDAFNPPGKDGKADHTHLNTHGAEVIAKIIAEELGKVAPDLAKLMK